MKEEQLRDRQKKRTKNRKKDTKCKQVQGNGRKRWKPGTADEGVRAYWNLLAARSTSVVDIVAAAIKDAGDTLRGNG